MKLPRGAAGEFPKTRLSAVAGVHSDDAAERRRAGQILATAYWRPIYKHLRVRWRRSPEEAEDLTQAFFAALLERRPFQGYDPARARFRTYIRSSLDNFVQDADRATSRQKRGGGAAFVEFDLEAAETELARGEAAWRSDVETLFDVEWKRALFAAAADALRASFEVRGKARHYRVFASYYLTEGEPPSYAQLGAELGIPVTDVTNSLSYARRQFRRFVLEKLRDLSGSDEEFELEARSLGVLD